MLEGVVKWFNAQRGFGFIEHNGNDYFAHFKEVKTNGYKTLNEGQSVTFTPGEAQKGKVALNITPKVN